MDQYNTAQANKMQYSTRLTQLYLLKPMTLISLVLQSEVEDFFKILQIIFVFCAPPPANSSYPNIYDDCMTRSCTESLRYTR